MIIDKNYFKNGNINISANIVSISTEYDKNDDSKFKSFIIAMNGDMDFIKVSIKYSSPIKPTIGSTLKAKMLFSLSEDARNNDDAEWNVSELSEKQVILKCNRNDAYIIINADHNMVLNGYFDFGKKYFGIEPVLESLLDKRCTNLEK